MSADGLDTVPANANPVAAGASPRWPLMDSARCIAIFAIVWLHTVRSEGLRPSTVLTRFAVPFFVAACVFLVFQGVWHKPQRGFLQYGYGRFRRIYVPFVAWSVIYLGLKAVKSVSLPDQPNDLPTGLEVLWTGTFYHLWFMPFIFVASLAAFLAARLASKVHIVRWPLAIGALAAGLTLAAPAVTDAVAGNCPSWALAVNALPAMFWAMTVSLALWQDAGDRLGRQGPGLPPAARERPTVRPSRLYTSATVLLFAGSMAWLGLFGSSALIENLAGVSLLLVTLCPIDRPLLRRLGQFAFLAYGIYLSHLVPVKVIESVAARRGLSPSWQLDLATFLVSASAATLITWVLYRCRWTRWLVA